MCIQVGEGAEKLHSQRGGSLGGAAGQITLLHLHTPHNPAELEFFKKVKKPATSRILPWPATIRQVAGYF